MGGAGCPRRVPFGCHARTDGSNRYDTARRPHHHGGSAGSEEPRTGVVDAAHRFVVEEHAPDTPVLGEHSRLRLDLLRGEHATHRREQRVAVEQVQVPGELFDTVDVAATLDPVSY